MCPKKTGLLFAFLLLCSGGTLAHSQGQGSGGDDLAAKTQNPVGAMYSLPFKFTFDYGADNGEASFLNIQPVLPQTVGEWNLIHRIIAPLIDTPGAVSGTPAIPNPIQGDGATGLGDINYSVFLSPAEPGKIIWGAGPSLTMDTATERSAGQWQMERRTHRGCARAAQALVNGTSGSAALVFCRRVRAQQGESTAC
jgi:hypothetical protein